MTSRLDTATNPTALCNAADAVRDDPADVDEAALKREIVRAHSGARSASDDDERTAWRSAHNRLLAALAEVRRWKAEQGEANSHAASGRVVERGDV